MTKTKAQIEAETEARVLTEWADDLDAEANVYEREGRSGRAKFVRESLVQRMRMAAQKASIRAEASE